MRFVLALALFSLLLSLPAGSTRVAGTVYSLPDLSPANSVIEVNSTPQQTVVARNGSYAFDLASPGSYSLSARGYVEVNGSLVLDGVAQENLTLASDTPVHIDLILSPALGDFPMFGSLNIPSTNLSETRQATEAIPPAPTASLVGYLLVFLALVLVSVALALWYLRSRGLTLPAQSPIVAAAQSQPVKEEAVSQAPPQTRPMDSSVAVGDERKVLDALQTRDGRMGQKELRKLFGWSEAKASLLITELEERGLLSRLRKGRGNIIRLKRDPDKPAV